VHQGHPLLDAGQRTRHGGEFVEHPVGQGRAVRPRHARDVHVSSLPTGVAIGVRGVQARKEVLAGLLRPVPGLLTRAEAGVHAGDDGVERRGDEQRDGVAVGVRGIDHPVRVGHPPVVGPDRHEVTEVHHQRVLGDIHPKPVSLPLITCRPPTPSSASRVTDP